MPTLTADSLVARAILAANRPVRSAAVPAKAERMARQETLEVWYDPQHAFLVAVGCLAMRAVSDEGRFCWLVREHGEADALSYAKSPYDVVTFGGDDGGLNIPHPAVTELAASLRHGHIQICLVAADFRGTGGIVRLLGACGMPGWLAAWLMPLTPTISRAIWAGHRRTLGLRQAQLTSQKVSQLLSLA